MAEKEATERRVYVLPVELVERIRQFQKDNLIASEVEAVRRLLDTALHMRDDVHTILKKMSGRFETEKDIRIISRDILAAHPLVEHIKISNNAIEFTLKDGMRGRFNNSGKLMTAVPGGRWADDLDDEIPF
ncbi:hypothetical protein [Xanthobacter aminoxidans]|uniref:Uncharacterized protein n=1 Tax=Xanthobacter aminoxidans TaxID=186280 RepID=A0ABW6ZBQ8_9HYPH